MYCVKQEWSLRTGLYIRDYIADTDAELTADFDPDCEPGSTVYVIATKEVWVKNSQRKWQKAGTEEVRA